MRALACLTALFSLAGCVNFSGLDAATEYSCKAPPGMPCQSLSGVVANYEAGNLPYQVQARAATAPLPAGRKPDAEAAPYGGPSGVPSGGTSQAQGAPAAPLPAAPVSEADRRISPRAMEAPSSGMPIRQPPLVLRIWIAPWEDETGDLHDQSYVYTMINPGRWLIDANRSHIQQEYRPILAPRKSAIPPAGPGATNGRANPADANAGVPASAVQGS